MLASLFLKFSFSLLLNSRSLLEMGTKDLDFVQLNQLIGEKTGGISVFPVTSTKQGSKDPVSHIMVRCKAMSANTEALFNLVCPFSCMERLIAYI